MTRAARTIPRDLPQGTYVELVTSLCGTRMPATIMTALFVLVGALTIQASYDPCLALLGLLGLIASIVRLGVLVRGRRRCDEAEMSPAGARRFERAFAVTYLAFATLFGLFAARALMLPLSDWRMPVAILVVGYAAGAASTVALRPRIVVWSLTLSVTPSSLVLLCEGDGSAAVSATCLLALLAGGLRSIAQRYRSQSTKTTKRQAFARLARTDHLTGLGNRLALVEGFAALEATATDAGIALHYIDLDDFKPVNDRLGHHAGDAVLRAVATRLQSCRRPGDLAVRLGGDEFVYVQSDAATTADLDAHAARIDAVLSPPYEIDGRAVVVGASIGSSRYTAGTGLDTLLASADETLRLRKLLRKMTPPAPAHQQDVASAEGLSRAA